MDRKKTRSYLRSKKFDLSQKIILGVIMITMLLVFFSAFFIIAASPEKQVQKRITSLATDYYENYIYPDIQKNNNKTDISGILEKYKDSGFSTLSLRQIILHDIEKNSTTYQYLKKYCDENNTLIKIYPEPPFNNTSYRVDYSYACDY